MGYADGMDGEVMRLFVAAEIPAGVRAALRRMQDILRRADARVTWVPPENIHLTLLFLGDVAGGGAPDRVALLRQLLDATVARHAPLVLAADGAGCFGSPRSPRVLWAGLADANGALARLQADLTGAIRAAGFVVEARPFHAHLTLGRVKAARPAAAAALTSLLESAKTTAFGTVPVGSLRLMRSRLEPQGARYETVHEAVLTGG